MDTENMRPLSRLELAALERQERIEAAKRLQAFQINRCRHPHITGKRINKNICGVCTSCGKVLERYAQ